MDIFPIYLEYLRKLVAMPSVFTQPTAVTKVMDYCQAVLTHWLADYVIERDNAGNVIALPRALDQRRPILYLSAHVDTVAAVIADWQPPFHPFQPYEDEHQLVARGVNDCKAGVAWQLLLAQLIGQQRLAATNVVFTLTFKEEGPGIKTAQTIAEKLGSSLPLSDEMTYLLVLENTVKLAAKPYLGYYLAERGNVVIELTGSLSELNQHVKRLTTWNPIAIEPLNAIPKEPAKVIKQQGGHICTVERNMNKLTACLLQAHDQQLMWAGDFREMAVVPTCIAMAASQDTVRHRLLLGKRSFTASAEVVKELAGLSYQPKKSLALSSGFDCRLSAPGQRFIRMLQQLADIMPTQSEYNPGASDAATIYNLLTPTQQKTFLPIVMGPGSRSQKSAHPPRLTHGCNETFDKLSGQSAVAALIKLLTELTFITPKQADF